MSDGEKQDVLNAKAIRGDKPPPKVTLAPPYLKKKKHRNDEEELDDVDLTPEEARKLKKKQFLEMKQKEENDARLRDEWFSFVQNKDRADILKSGMENLNSFVRWRQSQGYQKMVRLRPQTAPATSIPWTHVAKESETSAMESHKIHSRLIRQYISAIAPSNADTTKKTFKLEKHLAPYFLVAEEEVTSRRCIPLQLSQEKNVVVIGRAEKSDIVLEKSWVSADDLQSMSRRHCEVSLEKDVLYLKDCSSNGTFVNGKRCNNDTVILKIGDKIKFGNCNSKLEYVIVAPNVTAPISQFPPSRKASQSSLQTSISPADEMKRNRILAGEENLARQCADNAFSLWKNMNNIQPMAAARTFARFGEAGTSFQVVHAAAGFHHLAQTPLGINNILAAGAVQSLFHIVSRCSNSFYKELTLEVIGKLWKASAEGRGLMKKNKLMQSLMEERTREENRVIQHKIEAVVNELEKFDTERIELVDSRPSTAYSACSTVKASSRPTTAKLVNGRSFSRPSSALESSASWMQQKNIRALRPNTASGNSSQWYQSIFEPADLAGDEQAEGAGVDSFVTQPEGDGSALEVQQLVEEDSVPRDWIKPQEGRGSKWKAIRNNLLRTRVQGRPQSAMNRASRPLSGLHVRARPHSATEEHEHELGGRSEERVEEYPRDPLYDSDPSRSLRFRLPSRASQAGLELEPIDESASYLHDESSPNDSRQDPESPARPAERHGGDLMNGQDKAVMEKIRYKQKLMQSLKLMYTAEMAGLESEIFDLLQDVQPSEEMERD